jgi:hypothetical protein
MGQGGAGPGQQGTTSAPSGSAGTSST